ncbi:MAG: di-heme oxidoredictase family protein [Candidatus Binataceae bacterium]
MYLYVLTNMSSQISREVISQGSLNLTRSVPARRVLTLTLALVLCAVYAGAAVGACPPGFDDAPALPTHINQADIVDGKMSFGEIFRAGQRIFTTDFNRCDGAGRPGSTGSGAARTADPLTGPRFTRLSAPDSSSCASCHNEPQPGGAGDFVSNVFVLAQNENPVATTLLDLNFAQTFLERNTLGMFGSGSIGLLGREMTHDLLGIQSKAIAQAKETGQDVTAQLVTKGVPFGQIVAHADGSVDTGGVQGVDTDLIVKPFSRKGATRSVREFTVNAFNQHHGMQAVERFGEGTDPDQDGVADEMTIGDVTAVSIFHESLPIPVQQMPRDPKQAEIVGHGQKMFAKAGCASCHIPALTVGSTNFCEPDPMNPTSGAFKTFADTSQSYCFDLRKTSGMRGDVVNAYTDLKRHVICDDNKPEFCNEPPALLQLTDTGKPCPFNEYLTAKLWDVGNSTPYGHRGDVDTIYQAIIDHGGEAATSEANYEALPDSDQKAIVAFLKTLKMPIIAGDPEPMAAGSPRADREGDHLRLEH